MTGTVLNKTYAISSHSFDPSSRYIPHDELKGMASQLLKNVDPDVDFKSRRAIIIIFPGYLQPHLITDLRATTSEGVVNEAIVIGEKMLTLGVVVHELAHSFGLPDLYLTHDAPNSTGSLSAGVGPWCILSQTEPLVGLSSWARMRLGWIPPQRVAEIASGDTGSFDLAPLEEKTEWLQLIKVNVNKSLHYLIEARVKTQYDLQLPQEGVIIFRVDETLPAGNGGVTVVRTTPETTTLNDDAMDFSKGRTNVYIEQQQNMSITVVGRPEGKLRIIVSNANNGEEANVAAKRILQANDTIHWVMGESFEQGISEARGTLATALNAYSLGQYRRADELAVAAGEKAVFSVWPDEMRQARRLMTRMEIKLAQAESLALRSPVAQEYVTMALRDLDLSVKVWNSANYIEANMTVNSSRNNMEKALQAELTLFPERTEELTNFAAS